ncbi:MAG TPA: GNAT family N-acetyltransferase [Bryobacteraceae bacterium]|nr:GNAT family N-acetyltransferase [Bryobacteraceae bacterium]
MTGSPPLETPRLVLQPLALEDARQVQPLFGQWEVLKYLADAVPWPFPPDGALVYYRDVALPAMARGEAWHWTLRLKEEPGRIIGGISLIKGETNRGFWLGLPWQGRGLMTEAAERVTDFWFNELGFTVLFPRRSRTRLRGGFQRDRGCGWSRWKSAVMFAGAS